MKFLRLKKEKSSMDYYVNIDNIVSFYITGQHISIEFIGKEGKDKYEIFVITNDQKNQLASYVIT